MGVKTGVILKFGCLLILFIVTVIGWVGHFDSEWTKLWNRDHGFSYTCKNIDPECPGDAIGMEQAFLSFTIIFLILCAINIAAGFFLDFSKFKLIDAGFHGLAGLCILISGILILTSAIQIDVYIEKVVSHPYPYDNHNALGNNIVKSYYGQGHDRKLARFWEKVAAGILGILNGFAYFGTAGVLTKS